MNPYIIPGLKFRDNIPNDPEDIIETVLRYRGQTKEEVFTRNRKNNIMYTRHLIAYILLEKTDKTLKEVGDIIGGRDHTTIINSRKEINNLIWSDPLVKRDVKTILNKIKSWRE